MAEIKAKVKERAKVKASLKRSWLEHHELPRAGGNCKSGLSLLEGLELASVKRWLEFARAAQVGYISHSLLECPDFGRLAKAARVE